MSFLDSSAWFLLVLGGLAIVYWTLVASRVLRSVLRVPAVTAFRDGAAPPEGWPRVSIIVPAHNESEVIASCLASLRAQNYPDLEIILVLDRCTDDTEAVAQTAAEDDDRVRILINTDCPADWAGKCNAARVGAAVATGDRLLFTDADTLFDPDLVRASVAIAHARGSDLLSLLSTLRFRHAFECIAQPVTTMNLVRMYPIERVSHATSARPFANGQFMLFTRDRYDAIGGHASVKDDLLEDIAFARRVDDDGGRIDVVLADGMLVCAMYETLTEFRNGWKRIFIEACKRKPTRLRKNAWRNFVGGPVVAAVHLGGLLVGGWLLMGGTPWFGVTLMGVMLLALAVQTTVVAWIIRLGGGPWWGALFYPVGCFILWRILLDAASDLQARRPVVWGGREYILEPR